MEIATFAGGCFWCMEAIFQRLKGVQSVVPGYTGGTVPNPTYQDVCSGETGHAEAIQITFDPTLIAYAKLVEIFFHLHDPTTLDQQGNDIGTQYRSVIFYHDEEQKQTAEKVKAELQASPVYTNKRIVTEITPFTVFYEAEDYHKNYYERNSSQAYCNYVITPKLTKLLEEYRSHVKAEYLGNH